MNFMYYQAFIFENVTDDWAGTYKIRSIHLAGTCTYQAD
jgi:hypothetical protein